MRHALTALLVLGTAALPAMADEVWSTPFGEVIYEDELPTGEAVLTFPEVDGTTRSAAYLQGMAGVYTGRTYFEGVWVEPSTEGDCPVSIAHPETGELTNHWGRIRIIFTEPDFPSGWVALRGDCFDDMDQYLVGKPVTGE